MTGARARDNRRLAPCDVAHDPTHGQADDPIDGPVGPTRPPTGFPGGFVIRRSKPCARHPNGRAIYAVAFRRRGRRFFRVIGHADSMDETAARAIAARVIGEVKTGVRRRPITPNERRFEAFAATFFRRCAPNRKPVTLAGSRRACGSPADALLSGHGCRDGQPRGHAPAVRRAAPYFPRRCASGSSRREAGPIRRPQAVNAVRHSMRIWPASAPSEARNARSACRRHGPCH